MPSSPAVAEGSERSLPSTGRRDELALGLFNVTDNIASFEWDLPRLQELHRSLSEEMKAEVAAMVRLHLESSEMDKDKEVMRSAALADGLAHGSPAASVGPSSTWQGEA
jgi:hypothetical protein